VATVTLLIQGVQLDNVDWLCVQLLVQVESYGTETCPYSNQ